MVCFSILTSILFLTHLSEGRDVAKHFGCKFVETSAKQRINVDDAFTMLVREIRKYNKVRVANQSARSILTCNLQEQSSGRPMMPGNPSAGPPGTLPEHAEPKNTGCCGGCVVL